jgi:hypothetical protein
MVLKPMMVAPIKTENSGQLMATGLKTLVSSPQAAAVEP